MALNVCLNEFIAHILAPGAHARMPLVDRIADLKIPVTFICACDTANLSFFPAPYHFTDGDHDWMDPQGGTESVENMRKAGNGKGRMYIISNAGHHGMSKRTLGFLVSSDQMSIKYTSTMSRPSTISS